VSCRAGGELKRGKPSTVISNPQLERVRVQQPRGKEDGNKWRTKVAEEEDDTERLKSMKPSGHFRAV